MSTFVIAEPGSTADGLLSIMLRQIDEAATAGADAFKSQWVSNVAAMVARRNAPEYTRAYQRLSWPISWHPFLRTRCETCGMQYGCSIYLPYDAAVVAPYVDFLKISSFEARDGAMIRAAWGTGRRVIVSEGMGGGYVPSMLGRSTVKGPERLHCVSAYPAPLGAMNLQAIRARGLDGLSDHSRDIDMGALAVAAGAKIIEAHVRLDSCSLTNPDYDVSFTPSEFTEYIALIRRAETVMGDGVQRVQPCEVPMLQFRVPGA